MQQMPGRDAYLDGLLEESKRELLIRIVDAAYNGVGALANKECMASLTERLSDEAFRTQLMTRARVDPKAIRNLSQGVAALRKVVQSIRKG